MAKTESTAVNALIDLVQNKRTVAPSDPATDLFHAPPAPHRTTPAPGSLDVAPLPRSRAPQATREQPRPPMPRASSPSVVPPPPPAAMRASSPSVVPPPPPAKRATSTLPSLDVAPSNVRVTTGPVPRGTTIPPLANRPTGTLPPATAPVAAPFETKRPSLPELASKPELLFDTRVDETWVGTRPASGRTREDNIALAKMLALPALACIAAGIGLGFYVTANKTKAKAPTAAASLPTPAPSPTAARPTPSAPPTETVLHPTPRSIESQNAATSTAGGEQPQPPTPEEQAATVAAASAGEAGTLTHDAPATAVAGIQEVQTVKGVVKLTDVRIDTDPQGASVTLVDRGKQFPLGSTPLSTSLDTARQYDVIIEMAGRPSQMVHLDPASTSRLDVSLGRKQAAAAPAPVVEKKVVVAKTEKAVKATKADEPFFEMPKAQKAATSVTVPDETPAPDGGPAVADGTGVLMISSKPPCEILVDGKATGLTTPQPSLELAAGRHKVTFLNKEAGIKETFIVVVKPGEPTKLIKDFLDRK